MKGYSNDRQQEALDSGGEDHSYEKTLLLKEKFDRFLQKKV
jgi:hypothetical protein